VRCADDFAVVNLVRPEDVESVAAVVEHDHMVADATEAWRLLDEWALDLPVSTVVDRLRLLGIPSGAVPPPGAWWPEGSIPPGFPRSPVLRTELAAGPRRADPPLVVDLSSLWAGPLCAMLLGRAGARVVKVEFAQRLDGARRGNRDFYDVLHAGHDSVLLDPADARDHDMLCRLLAAADIVVEASRPRALQSWGIDAPALCERTPTTWVSITAYGRRFPERVGFGDDVAMASGLAVRDPGDEWPLPCGDAIADPLAGMHAAVHAMASHLAGGSRLLDIAMSEVAASTVAWSPTCAQPLEGAPAPVPPDAGPGLAAAAPGRDTAKWRNA
jgi:hypothetical protein